MYKQFISFNFNDLTNEEIENIFDSTEIFVKVVNLNNYDIDLRKKIQNYEAFEIFNQPIRIYRHGELFSHVIGYTGNPNQSEIIEFVNSEENKTVGKNGIERYYENILSGKASKITLQNGEIIEILPVIPGQDIQLTIDLNTQEVVKESLQQGIELANKSFETQMQLKEEQLLFKKLIQVK